MHDNITTQLLDQGQAADLRYSVFNTPFVHRSMFIANAVSAAGVAQQYGHDALLYIQSHDAHAKPTPVQALLASYPRFGSDLTAAHVAKLEERQIEVQGFTLDIQLHALYICASHLLSGYRSATLKSAGDFIHIYDAFNAYSFDSSKPICAAESLGLQRHLLAAPCLLVHEHRLLKRTCKGECVPVLNSLNAQSWWCLVMAKHHIILLRNTVVQGSARCRRSSQSRFAAAQLLSMPCSLHTMSALMR